MVSGEVTFMEVVMRNIYKILIILAIFSTQQAFAGNDRSCMKMANACLDAGYTAHQSMTKGMWMACMKPLLLGQKVSGVKLKPTVVKVCREHKIREMQKEIKEFKEVK